jgi:hypothetical protein
MVAAAEVVAEPAAEVVLAAVEAEAEAELVLAEAVLVLVVAVAAEVGVPVEVLVPVVVGCMAQAFRRHAGMACLGRILVAYRIQSTIIIMCNITTIIIAALS